MNEIKQNRITSPESRLRSWPMRTVGSFCKVVRGSSPRPGGSPLYFNGDHLPWITVGEVTSHGQMHLRTTSSKLTEEGAKQTRILQPNTLILTNSGATLGVPKITTFVAGANDGIAAFLNVNGMDIEFLYFALQAQTEFMRERLAPGVGQPNLNTEIIAELLVPCPPLIEQKKIAALLTTWDDAIELIEILIAAKRQRKDALMQMLFMGKMRLPGFGKYHWRKCNLGEVASNSPSRNGTTTKSPLVYSVTNSVGMVPMSEDVIGESIDRYKTVGKHDFAYNPMRINVGSIAMWDGDEEVLVSPDYVVFQCNPELDAEFLNHFRKTHYWHQFVNRSGGGSVRVRIYFSDLAGMALKLPPLDEQKAIAAVLNTQDREIELLQQKLDALRRQKKGLMQQLLTGKMRVKVTESSGV